MKCNSCAVLIIAAAAPRLRSDHTSRAADASSSQWEKRTWTTVKGSGYWRLQNSSSDSPFSVTIIGGSGAMLSGGGKPSVERSVIESSIFDTGGIASLISCTRGKLHH